MSLNLEKLQTYEQVEEWVERLTKFLPKSQTVSLVILFQQFV